MLLGLLKKKDPVFTLDSYISRQERQGQLKNWAFFMAIVFLCIQPFYGFSLESLSVTLLAFLSIIVLTWLMLKIIQKRHPKAPVTFEDTHFSFYRGKHKARIHYDRILDFYEVPIYDTTGYPSDLLFTSIQFKLTSKTLSYTENPIFRIIDNIGQASIIFNSDQDLLIKGIPQSQDPMTKIKKVLEDYRAKNVS